MNLTIQNAKRQGEYAEMVFQVAATRHGLVLSRPFGDSMPYDFITDNGHSLLRIQVKSVTARQYKRYRIDLRHGNFRWRIPGRAVRARYHWAYAISTHRGRKEKMRSYDPSQIDFIAAYVIPADVWYIIPITALQNRIMVCVAPENPASKRHFDRYREAWHLLQ